MILVKNLFFRHSVKNMTKAALICTIGWLTSTNKYSPHEVLDKFTQVI